MAKSKKRRARPNHGGTLRPQAEAPRKRFLYTDVTESEYENIREYCVKRQISLSQFLADLVLKDAAKPKPQRTDKIIRNITIELTPEQDDKLQLLARLREKESVDEFVREILEPNFKVQRLHSPLETRMLRYYLSEEEHEMVTSYIASTGISARNYAAMLAIKEIRKNRDKK